MGIELVNVKIDRLADVFSTMEQLGVAARETEKGHEAARRFARGAGGSADGVRGSRASVGADRAR